MSAMEKYNGSINWWQNITTMVKSYIVIRERFSYWYKARNNQKYQLMITVIQMAVWWRYNMLQWHHSVPDMVTHLRLEICLCVMEWTYTKNGAEKYKGRFQCRIHYTESHKKLSSIILKVLNIIPPLLGDILEAS